MALIIKFKPQEAALILRNGKIIGKMTNAGKSSTKMAFVDLDQDGVEIIRENLWEFLEARRNGQEKEA